MSVQQDVNEKMRAILVDWLVEVHSKFKLLPETIFLTINLIDWYLMTEKVSRDKLQLVGVASMLIATKYEEIYAPEVKDFVYISDNAYTSEQILSMEYNILKCLNFDVTTPSSLWFVDFLCKYSHSDSYIRYLSTYIVELSLVEYKLLKYQPSLLASSAIYLSNKILKKSKLDGQSHWGGTTLEEYTHYNESDVRSCAKDLCLLL